MVEHTNRCAGDLLESKPAVNPGKKLPDALRITVDLFHELKIR